MPIKYNFSSRPSFAPPVEAKRRSRYSGLKQSVDPAIRGPVKFTSVTVYQVKLTK